MPAISDARLHEARAIDGMQNLLTGQGGRSDSRAYSARRFWHIERHYTELLATYRSHWAAARIVELPAEEMTRTKRHFLIEDTEKLDAIRAEAERMAVWERIREAIQWADLLGGAALFLGVEDGLELEEPLDLDRVKPGSLKFVHALDRQTLVPWGAEDILTINDPTSPQFMLPEFYQVVSARLEKVHHSRIIRFPGLPLPWLEMPRTQYWGGSRVDRTFDAIADAETVIGGVAALVTEAKVDVYKIPGLMNILATPEGEAKVKRRVELANQVKSVWQAIISDAGEEYESKQNAIVQGMTGLIESFLGIVAAASGIPATKLLGTAAQGMNATGEGDLTNYYDMIDSRREAYLRPRLNAFDQVFLRSAIGEGPENCPWEFGLLRQMSAGETAELENKRAARDKIYLDAGVIDEVVVAKQLKEDGTYSAIDDEYITELEADIEEFESNPPPPAPGLPGLPGLPPARPEKRDPGGNLIPEPQDE